MANPTKPKRVMPQNLVPRGLSRNDAAGYLSLSVGFFDQLVKEGKLPQPVRIGSRTIWDRFAIDDAFDEMVVHKPDEDNEDKRYWDEYLASQREKLSK